MGRIYTVYEIAGPDGVYVGSSALNLSRRWSRHCVAARRSGSSPFHSAIRAHGPDAFTVRAVERCSTPEEGREREAARIAELRADGVALYNVRKGGGGRWCADEVYRAPARPKRARSPHVRCGACGLRGHNQRTCPRRPRDLARDPLDALIDAAIARRTTSPTPASPPASPLDAGAGGAGVGALLMEAR